MSRNRDGWIVRIKRVEAEYLAMRQAADRFAAEVKRDPSLLTKPVRVRDVQAASAKLEGTYLVRLFAEFETGARECWVATARDTHPKTSDLIDGLAARCSVPPLQRENVHRVREYRNSLVHEGDDAVEVIGVIVARSYLCHFFSLLPQDW